MSNTVEEKTPVAPKAHRNQVSLVIKDLFLRDVRWALPAAVAIPSLLLYYFIFNGGPRNANQIALVSVGIILAVLGFFKARFAMPYFVDQGISRKSVFAGAVVQGLLLAVVCSVGFTCIAYFFFNIPSFYLYSYAVLSTIPRAFLPLAVMTLFWFWVLYLMGWFTGTVSLPKQNVWRVIAILGVVVFVLSVPFIYRNLWLFDLPRYVRGSAVILDYYRRIPVPRTLYPLLDVLGPFSRRFVMGIDPLPLLGDKYPTTLVSSLESLVIILFPVGALWLAIKKKSVRP